MQVGRQDHPGRRFAVAVGASVSIVSLVACFATIDESRLSAAVTADAAAREGPGQGPGPGQLLEDATTVNPFAFDSGLGGFNLKFCNSQAVTWVQNGLSCSGVQLLPLLEGTSTKVADHLLKETGTVTVRCEDGGLTQLDPICTKPVKIGFDNKTKCNNASCVASTSTACAGDSAPTPAKRGDMALLACKTNGFSSASEFEIGTTELGRACWPDGTHCFDVVDVGCVEVFSTVTCHY